MPRNLQQEPQITAKWHATQHQLEGVEVAKVFTDRASGNPQLEERIAFVRKGDTIVVHSIDRLARNLDNLRRLVQDFTSPSLCSVCEREHDLHG